MDGIKNNTLQIDLKGKTIENSVSKKTIQKIKRIIPLLYFFSPNQHSYFEDFKIEFLKKYEQEEVPLLIAINEDFGIGYPIKKNHLPSPLLDDITFPSSKTVQYKEYSIKDSFLIKKLSSLLVNKNDSVDNFILELTDFDVNYLKTTISDRDTLPYSLSALVELYKNNIYVNSFSSSAANLIGRFSPYDYSILENIKKIHENEFNFFSGNSLFAEISHLPKDRDGNVLLRESITDYEIPIISSSNRSFEKQIKLDDLYLSIKNDELIISSKKLNKKYHS